MTMQIYKITIIMEKEIEALREQFFKETNIAPVFAERLPYINYINWLEAKLIEKK
jgi:hypothetical protein